MHGETLFVSKGSRCVGLTTLPSICLEMWEPQTPGTLRVCPGIALLCYSYIFNLLLHQRRNLHREQKPVNNIMYYI